MAIRVDIGDRRAVDRAALDAGLAELGGAFIEVKARRPAIEAPATPSRATCSFVAISAHAPIWGP